MMGINQTPMAKGDRIQLLRNFGVSLMSFLYARDLLAYYGIGIFLGFVSNMVVRVAGTAAGGKLGEGLLEISALERKG